MDQLADLRQGLAAPIPQFLDSVWLLPGCILIPERRWYLHVGKGKSLRTAEKMPQAITRRALHHAMQAPEHLDVHQALRWGQLRSWGASADLVAEVLQSRMVNDLGHGEEWSRLLEKVSADPAFDPRDFGMIADLIRELLTRSRTNHVHILLNLPLSELRDHCYRHWKKIYDYARACSIPFRQDDMRHAGLRGELNHIGTARWSPMDEVRSFEILRVSPAGTPSRWTISEQCSHVRLLTEAAYMRHCVGRYWRRCSKGNSAVFSLSQYPLEMEPGRMIPRLTIEVHPATRRVVQVRGRWNRPPDPFERNLIRIWAERNQLKVAV